jgi:hypothetical protein
MRPTPPGIKAAADRAASPKTPPAADRAVRAARRPRGQERRDQGRPGEAYREGAALTRGTGI